MAPEVANFAVVAVVIVGLVSGLAGVTVWMVNALKRGHRAELPNPLYEERLDQLQQSVDAIAVEVERIAEAQRFSAKLLADRADTPALPR
jgi:hypothetical protein